MEKCKCYINHGDGDIEEIIQCTLCKSAPDLLLASKYALGTIRIARQYFPKSIKNSDKFTLENTCATLGSAIAKAENTG